MEDDAAAPLQVPVGEVVTYPSKDRTALKQFLEDRKCRINPAIRPEDDRLPLRAVVRSTYFPTSVGRLAYDLTDIGHDRCQDCRIIEPLRPSEASGSSIDPL